MGNTSDGYLYNVLLTMIVKDRFLRRQLPWTNCKEICGNYTHIVCRINAEIEKIVQLIASFPDWTHEVLGIESDEGVRDIIRQIIPDDPTSIGREGPMYVAPTFSTDTTCAVYRIMRTANKRRAKLFCLHGIFNETKTLEKGDLIVDESLVYSGEFKMGVPWGEGIMYDNGRIQVKGTFVRGTPSGHAVYHMQSGAIRYDGEWLNGQQHGYGTLYYEDSPMVSFHGNFDANEAHTGTWYNDDGTLIHTGNVEWFRDQVENCHKKHQCTYSFTKNCHTKQQWWHCKTCYSSTNMGCCRACALSCHRGHELVRKPESSFFCDCGAGEPKVEGLVCKTMQGCDSNDCDCATSVEHNEGAAVIEEIDEEEVPDIEEDDPPNLPDIIRQEIAQRGGNYRVFLELNPDNMQVIGLQLVQNNNNNEDNNNVQNNNNNEDNNNEDQLVQNNNNNNEDQ
jgi:hypothetical protein